MYNINLILNHTKFVKCRNGLWCHNKIHVVLTAINQSIDL